MSLPLDLSSLHRDASMGTLEKQLICPICLEVFTKPVVILPCQHNLCRKCANVLYQPSLFQVGIGGHFRCPSCRHEVVLDRHGVYGLQRNLLVENIIDIYKQASVSSRPPQKTSIQAYCEEHEGEKLNIYCITCQTPTCSLCKVFGPHKSCQVSPFSEVYQQQKAELSDGIGSLAANNDCIQVHINGLEELCRNIEENGRNQKQILGEKFDRMCGILEERHKIMLQKITCEQEEKTSWVQSLLQTYSEHVESNTKLVQTALNAMEESDMAAFLQTSGNLIEMVNKAATLHPVDTLQPGYENMDHYKVDFTAEEKALYQLDFMKSEPCVVPAEDVVDETLEEPKEPKCEQDPEPELQPEAENELSHELLHDLLSTNEPDHEQNADECEIKNTLPDRREEKVLGEKGGMNTQQAIIHVLFVLAFLFILQRVWGNIQCLFCI